MTKERLLRLGAAAICLVLAAFEGEMAAVSHGLVAMGCAVVAALALLVGIVELVLAAAVDAPDDVE